MTKNYEKKVNKFVYLKKKSYLCAIFLYTCAKTVTNNKNIGLGVVTLVMCLFVSVFSYAQAQVNLGANVSSAPAIEETSDAAVSDGTENYFMIAAEHLPASVYYFPDTAFGPIPELISAIENDTLQAVMVSESCRMAWKWELQAADEENPVRYFYFSSHENATARILPSVCLPTTSDTTAVACDSLLWKGVWRYASGDYEYVTKNAEGCDSIRTLHLTINHPTIGEETMEECDSLLWHELWYKESGDYEFHTQNAAGCDSTAILHLTIHHALTQTLPDTTVCETDFGYEYIWGDTIIRDAGTYTRYLKTKVGCDSIVTQTVHFSEMTYGERTVTAYDSYTTNMGITYRTSQHGPIEYYTNAAGCDSVVTLDLYIRHLQVVDTFPISVCSSELPFVWYGKSLTEAGIYTTDTIEGEAVNAVYMDTVHTVNLIVLPTSEGDTTATACESFVWYDETYTASGEYNRTLTNAVGCDSVVTLHLTIYHATAGDTAAVACNTFDWYGQTYTQSGEYNHTFVGGNSHGCDSTVTLHLTIRTSTMGEETQEACVSYEWNNEVYTASGDYTYHTTNVAGCDSTATLHLTIHQPTTGEETQEACMSYVWKNQTYTESGDYTFTTVNAAGCDSVVTLHLTILEGCATFDTVYYCLGLNTEHDEKIAEDRIRRYRAYVFESPAEWDYMEGVVVRGERHRTLVDLRRAEANLYAHYVNGLEPVSAITWSYRPDGASAYQTIEAGTQAQWIENGVIAVQVQFLCGHIYRSDMTTDMEAIGDDQSQMEGKKILKDGQIVIIRNGKMYTIFGLEIRD